MLTHDMQHDNMHGCISVLILKNDRLIFEKAMGYKHAAEDIAADSATIYCIASITKTFTATLLLQLVEQGKIKLDDPVENYIPEIKSLVGYTANTVITFRQLASHTAGLAREPDYRNGMSGPVEQWENKLLACIPHTSIENPPGKVYQYSNIGFALLGLALERVAHIPYIQLIQQKILTPLKMDESFFSVPESKQGDLADGLLNMDNIKMEKIPTTPTLKNIGHDGWGYSVPCGGLYATSRDLAKFITGLTGQQSLLNAASLKEMQTIQPVAEKYGLGLMIYNKEPNAIGHSGSTYGYGSDFRVDQKSGYTVIVMRNYKTGKTNLEYESWKLLSKLAKQ